VNAGFKTWMRSLIKDMLLPSIKTITKSKFRFEVLSILLPRNGATTPMKLIGPQ
jgi:hypothetical protein